MTQEQYNRAIEINGRLTELDLAKKQIQQGENRKCNLAYSYSIRSGDYSFCSEYAMKCISEILDRHDKMIREEIDAEIEKLKKEIEEL